VLKHKRLVSIIATIAFCLSFLAPALIAPAPAVAAATYEAISAPTIGSNPAAPVELGVVKVWIPDLTAFKGRSETLSVSVPGEMFNPANIATYPAGNTFATTLAGVAANAAAAAAANNVVWVEVPATYDADPAHLNQLSGAVTVSATSKSGFDIKINGAGITGMAPGLMYIYFGYTNAATTYGIDVTGKSGDLAATFSCPSGSAFTAGSVTIGKISSSSLVIPAAASKASLSTAGGKLGTIAIVESVPGAIQPGDTFTFKLPSGYEWINGRTPGADITATGSWGLSANAPAPAPADITVDYTTDKQKLVVTAASTFAPSTTTSGRIVVGSDALDVVLGIDTFPYIKVTDDSKLGDVVVSVTSNRCDLSASEITVAAIQDFGAEVIEGTAKDVKAGRRAVELGSFYIEEGAAGSLVQDRTISLTLPDGVKWTSTGGKAMFSKTTEKGDTVIQVADFSVNGGLTNDSDARKVLKGKVNRSGVAPSTGTKTKIDKLCVDIAPNFSGDLIVEISGSAGLNGKVKVATVTPPVTVEASGSATNVVIGQSNQTIPDILIKENFAGALAKNASQSKFVLFLPPGVTFTNTPKVEVTEGDLTIDTGLLTKTVAYNNILRGALELTVKSDSVKPSTIKVSDINLTLDRTVPEGELAVYVNGGDFLGLQDAIDENKVSVVGTGPAFNYDFIASVNAAKCVTPSGDQGRSASFYIGSTIMNVNGANIIMDAAPYIKAGRTYVPVRYLGDALGATTAWDADTKTVTVTKGDNTVVLVIGSTIAKVNGADVQMDVAPEITGVGRTMLPARWVAEGLGYQVGWNAVLQQVVIQ
jgi:hypothetical protein